MAGLWFSLSYFRCVFVWSMLEVYRNVPNVRELAQSCDNDTGWTMEKTGFNSQEK
jgi:hypothetical protein